MHYITKLLQNQVFLEQKRQKYAPKRCFHAVFHHF